MTISVFNNKVWDITKRCVAVIIVPLVMSAPQAYAEGSFLLQLGTFESRAEATQKWEDVRAANNDAMAGLQGHVAEVMLPPDNVASYRTQVGPVDSRRTAKTLCKTLQSRDVQCFVVETAFAAADLSPEMAGELTNIPAPASYMPTTIPVVQAAPAAPIAATEAITTSSISLPVEVAPDNTVKEDVKVEQSEGGDNASANDTSSSRQVVASVPEVKKTVIQTSSRSSNRPFNPNDVKKSGFFRGTFRLNNEETEPSEEQITASEVKEPIVVKSTSNADNDRPGFFGRLFGSSRTEEKTEISTPANVKGDVEVAEAIRVPVTSGDNFGTTQYQPVFEKTSVGSGTSDATQAADNAHTFWVQVGYFNNENKAHAFYEELKLSSPEFFEDVRIRITRPFAARSARASLRMGPLTSAAAVKVVCAEAKSQKMRCTTIRDTGDQLTPYDPMRVKKYLSPLEAVDIPGYRTPSAPTPSIPPSPNASYIPTSTGTISDTGVGGQWVSLGGFPTAQTAWNHWKALQSTLPELHDVQSSITGSLSNNKSAKYQLRAGPVTTDIDAENICKAVVNTGNICSPTEAP